MKNKLINDITKKVVWDATHQKYFLNPESKLTEHNIYTKALTKQVGEINIPNVNDVLLQEYQFINKLKTTIVENSIKKMECIKEIVFVSIQQKSGQKIALVNTACVNKDHINAAKRFITELNNFCYKHEIVEIMCDRIFLFLENELSFLGHIDLLLKGRQKNYLIELKTSKTNYTEKYQAQLFLNKMLVENSRTLKIEGVYVLNIFEQQTILNLDGINKKTEHKLLGLLKNYKKN